MRIIKKRIVGSLLVSKDDHLLLGYKDPKWGGRYSDCWVLPGGAVDEGETDMEALHREIKEEVDLDIAPYESVLIDDSLTGENKTIHNVTGEPVTFKMQFFDYLTKIQKTLKIYSLLQRTTSPGPNGYLSKNYLSTIYLLQRKTC